MENSQFIDGGEVEQFLNIPKIYKGENLSLSKEWENKLEYHFFNNIGDNQNYETEKILLILIINFIIP